MKKSRKFSGWLAPRSSRSWPFALIFALLAPMARAGALQWQQGNGYRFADVQVPADGKTGFALRPGQSTGISFTNHLSDFFAAKNRILENGSGVALGDVDGDGWCDIYFCRLEGPNVLYRNLGNWRFEDITQSAGVACDGQFSTGALLADVDGNGTLDLLVNSIGGGTRLFLNDGKAHFTEVMDSGLARQFGSTSMAMADIDGDGDLELYVANYRTTTFKDAPPGIVPPQTRRVDGKIVVTPEDRFAGVLTKGGAIRLREVGEPDILYVNKGQGHFGAISWLSGAFVDDEGNKLSGLPRDWGLSAMFRDINGDGTPDIYVCNDFFYSPDRVWLNEGGRRFRAAPRLALRDMSMSSMSVDFADINRDGFDDIFVADMLSRDHLARHRQRANTMLMREAPLPITDSEFRPEVIRNTLFLNRGDGTYAEIAQFAGLQATEWSWSAIFMDVDLDGYEDLLITNGNDRDVLDADTIRETAVAGKSAEQHLKDLQKFPRLETANLAFRNRGDLTFEEKGASWGFNTPGVSHGMALADLDNDGDLDVVVNNLNSGAGIYRNETPAARVAIRLKGVAPNTRGIGAKIKVSGGPVTQSQEMIAGGRYLSCDDSVRVFAGGSATNNLKIEVTWRSGRRSVVDKAKPNRVYEIEENPATTQPPASAIASTEKPWFTDVSETLKHSHHDEAFDDYLRQPLLPFKLSQLGPGVAWFDLDGDGWDDLIIGSGQGGAMALFQNDQKGGFNRFAHPPFDHAATRDQTGIVAWKKASGETAVLAGSANYEDGLVTGSSVRQFNILAGTIDDSLPQQTSSAGPLALADIDGDGDLDLFVGGAVIPGRWPEPADSKIFRSDGNKFQLDEPNSGVLKNVGLVSGAVWSDLDGDGFPELILACRWGPIRVFKNQAGNLHEMTAELGLDQFTGWWNSVTTGDLDGDGKLDIIAGNWGLNSGYRASAENPIHVFYGDLLDRGTVDLIETEYDSSGTLVPLRPLDILGVAIPPLRERFTTHRAFGQATVSDLLKPYAPRFRELKVTTLASMVFLNRPGHFKPIEVPAEAQFAPVFGINVADFDGDGNEDIFLGQNFFDVQPELSRCDAGRGLLLFNDGTGKLIAIPGEKSGIKIYGEQRGSACSDFNHDGRIDLAVTQNNGPTKLYVNTMAAPGLRVRLNGPVGNRFGIGATLRLISQQRSGPIHEAHAGSGYWSLDSPIQVLANSPPGTEIRVQWPGGNTKTSAIPAGAQEIEIDSSGKIRLVR